MLLPLLRFIWLMLLPCVMLLPLVEIILADVIANVVAAVIATSLILWQMLCHYWCTIGMVVAEGIVVPVADVIATRSCSLADVIANG